MQKHDIPLPEKVEAVPGKDVLNTWWQHQAKAPL